MNLRAALLGCSSGQLGRIAAAWGIHVEAGTLRRELVEIVAARCEAELADPALWERLGSQAAHVVRMLVRAGGRHEVDLLTRRLARTLSDRAPDDATGAVEAAIAALVERGLLVRTFSAGEQQRGVYLLAPDEVIAAVDLRPAPPGLGVPFPQAPEPAVTTTTDVAADLFVLASALRRESWGAASRGLAGRPPRTVEQLLARLRRLASAGPGDPTRRWRFLLWVAQRADWLSRDALPAPDEGELGRLLADPDSLPARALAAGPVSADGAPAVPDARAAARQRQANMLQLLSELGDDAWWDAADVSRWLVDVLADHDPDQPGNVRLETLRERQTAQITRWLKGRWFWLGLVEWGQVEWGQTDGAWSVLRPTAALRALVSGRAPLPRPGPRPCTLADDQRLTLTAPPDADLPRLFLAERYLAFGGGGGREPRQYGLTPASMDRGVRLGGDADELRDLLERLTQCPLPATWTQAISRWQDSALRLRLTPGLLLSSARQETLSEALTIPAAQGFVQERLSPRHALVDGAHVARLLADLAQAGYPVDVDASLRAEPTHTSRASALANGVAETAWVALEVLRRLAPDVVDAQRDLLAARARLDAVLPASVVEGLHRRATSIVAAMGQGKRPTARRPRPRVV